MSRLKTPIAVSGSGAEQQVLAEMRAQIAALTVQLSSGQSWTALPFEAAWENYSIEQEACVYSKDKFGWVSIMGLCKNNKNYTYSSTNATIATLPEFFRPAKNVIAEKGFFDGTNHGILRIDIRAAGQLVLTESLSAPGNGGTPGFVNLSGIRFVAGL